MSQPNQYELLKQIRFLPFFLAQFLGAFIRSARKRVELGQLEPPRF